MHIFLANNITRRLLNWYGAPTFAVAEDSSGQF